MPKTLVISRYFPPAIGGTPTVLKNLFRSFSHEDFFVVSARPRVSETPELIYRGEAVDFPLAWRRLLGRYLIPFYIFLLPFIWRALFRIKKKWEPTQILIVYPDPFFSVAGYLFAAWTRLPYSVYFHDLFLEAQAKPSRFIQRLLARLFEKRMISGSRRFFAVSEGLRDFYRNKYGLAPQVVPHSIDRRIINENPQPDVRFRAAVRIVYTGGIYDNQRDTFQIFVRSLREASFPHKLVIASQKPREYFERLGVIGPEDEVVFLKERREVFSLQRGATFLYLPLAWNSSSRQEVMTSIPTKLFEYAAAMRPIFVHCPPESALARFCLDRGIGDVCASVHPSDILAAVEKMLCGRVDVARVASFLSGYDRDVIGAAFREALGYNPSSSRKEAC